jgi:hypothetical protein
MIRQETTTIYIHCSIVKTCDVKGRQCIPSRSLLKEYDIEVVLPGGRLVVRERTIRATCYQPMNSLHLLKNFLKCKDKNICRTLNAAERHQPIAAAGGRIPTFAAARQSYSISICPSPKTIKETSFIRSLQLNQKLNLLLEEFCRNNLLENRSTSETRRF